MGDTGGKISNNENRPEGAADAEHGGLAKQVGLHVCLHGVRAGMHVRVPLYVLWKERCGDV